MADEDYGIGSGGTDIQNPNDWFEDYSYDQNEDRVTFEVNTNESSKGFGDGKFAAATGDVRAVYHAIIDKLYGQYATKEGTSGFNMPDHMKMGKAEVTDITNSKKTTVYTFSIEQSQTTTSGNASYINENNT